MGQVVVDDDVTMVEILDSRTRRIQST